MGLIDSAYIAETRRYGASLACAWLIMRTNPHQISGSCKTDHGEATGSQEAISNGATSGGKSELYAHTT